MKQTLSTLEMTTHTLMALRMKTRLLVDKVIAIIIADIATQFMLQISALRLVVNSFWEFVSTLRVDEPTMQTQARKCFSCILQPINHGLQISAYIIDSIYGKAIDQTLPSATVRCFELVFDYIHAPI